ncbi:CDP-diacylglycerol--serine O-phosphatidyltransferase [Streptomyces sp. NPDC088768]|uniref:CDP-diacylglycerol--serine O-phosphatidyltransferase n=1 Tax=unclassified Streptomyces TaxID=2593676 RepID=UPI000B896B00|nr:CDP-diacylglycerol--serine O-phosphatidyltransferase [Streptomyces sp. TverLS-915]
MILSVTEPETTTRTWRRGRRTARLSRLPRQVHRPAAGAGRTPLSASAPSPAPARTAAGTSTGTALAEVPSAPSPGTPPGAPSGGSGGEEEVRMRLSLADLLTLGNAVCGFAAIYCVTTAVLIPHLLDGTSGDGVRQGGASAVMFILLGALFDLCDGIVARRFGGSGMGPELDNLSDLISFGLAPAYFVLVWGLVGGGENHLGLATVSAVAVLLGGVMRLARFSITTMRDGMFEGMPIPFAALTVLSVVLLQLSFVVTVLAVLAIAYLMVSRVAYPKPSGRLAVATAAWGAVNIGCLVAWALDCPGGETLLVTGCCLQVALAAALPVTAGVRRVAGRRFA